MLSVSLHQARDDLSQLADVAAGGEDVLRIRDGRPVARLTQVNGGSEPIKERLSDEELFRRRAAGFGLLKGKITVPDDLAAPMSDEDADLFYNGPIFPRRGST